MPKSFYHTHDGDQISVKFEYIEEKMAFESAIRLLEDYLKDKRDGTEPLFLSKNIILFSLIASQQIKGYN